MALINNACAIGGPCTEDWLLADVKSASIRFGVNAADEEGVERDEDEIEEETKNRSN